jgi:geranylgeranyl diphosphate synthase type I
MDLTDFKVEFDSHLLLFLQEKIKEGKELADNKRIQLWLDYLSVLFLAGGKRLRPFAVSSMYATAGGTNKAEMWKGAISLELFHLFAMIHDDIMDRGVLRHGIASTHVYIRETLLGSPDAAHTGEAQAIVLGDLLQGWAAEIMPVVAKDFYHAMVSEVIIGQMLDLNQLHEAETLEADILRKYELKTARYTFVRPMQIGVRLAGGSKELLTFCEDFGTALGIAFQIQDDLLDITATTQTNQKGIFRDIQSGEPTIFTAYIINQGTSRQENLLHSYFGHPLKDDQYAKIKQLFTESGALQYGRTLISKYCEQALEIVKKAPLTVEQQKQWSDLVTLVQARKY